MDTLPSAAAVRKGKKPKRAIEESISEEKKCSATRNTHSSLVINFRFFCLSLGECMAGPGYVATCLSLSEILPKTQWSEWMSDFLCWLDLLLMLSELISFCAIMFWWNPPRYFIHVCHQHSSFEILLSFPELHIFLLSCRNQRYREKFLPELHWRMSEQACISIFSLEDIVCDRVSAVVTKIFFTSFRFFV